MSFHKEENLFYTVLLEQKAGQNHNLILTNEYIENVAEFKYLGTKLRSTRFGTLIVATIYLQLIQDRYMFRSFTVLHCSHQHCVQLVASDVEVVGYL